MENSTPLISIEETAARLGKSVSTIYRLCKNHTLQMQKCPITQISKISLQSVERYRLTRLNVIDQLLNRIDQLERRVAHLEKEKLETGESKSHNPKAIKNILRDIHDI